MYLIDAMFQVSQVIVLAKVKFSCLILQENLNKFFLMSFLFYY